MIIKILVISILIGSAHSCTTCPGNNQSPDSFFGPNINFYGDGTLDVVKTGLGTKLGYSNQGYGSNFGGNFGGGREAGFAFGSGIPSSLNNGRRQSTFRGLGGGFEGARNDGRFRRFNTAPQVGSVKLPNSKQESGGHILGGRPWSSRQLGAGAIEGQVPEHVHFTCSLQNFSPYRQQQGSESNYGGSNPSGFGGSTRTRSPGAQAETRPLLLCRQETRAKRQAGLPSSSGLPAGPSGLPRFDHLHVTCYAPEELLGRSAGSAFSNNNNRGSGSGGTFSGGQTPVSGQLTCFLDAMAAEFGEAPVIFGSAQGHPTFVGNGGHGGFPSTNIPSSSIAPNNANNNADLHLICYDVDKLGTSPAPPGFPTSPVHLMCFDEQPSEGSGGDQAFPGFQDEIGGRGGLGGSGRLGGNTGFDGSEESRRTGGIGGSFLRGSVLSSKGRLTFNGASSRG